MVKENKGKTMKIEIISKLCPENCIDYESCGGREDLPKVGDILEATEAPYTGTDNNSNYNTFCTAMFILDPSKYAGKNPEINKEYLDSPHFVIETELKRYDKKLNGKTIFLIPQDRAIIISSQNKDEDVEKMDKSEFLSELGELDL